MPPDDPFDQLALALHDMRARFGDAAFADRRRLISLLVDKVPDARRDIRAIGTALDERVPAALAQVERHLLGMEMDRQADRLEGITGLRVDLARQVVRAIAFALDRGPLPSVFRTADPLPDEGWAGVSQPVGAAPIAPIQAAAVPVRAQNKPYMAIGAAMLAAVLGGGYLLGREKAPATPPGPTQTAMVGQNYAGELTDHGVAAKRALESNVGSPTPLDVPVGRRVTTAEVRQMLASDRSALLVDVLANTHPTSLPNAAYLPSAGLPGTVTDATQALVAGQLRAAVGDQPRRPLIFFCAGAICWESYNALLRAEAAGFGNVFWYRGGLAAWAEAGLPMQPLVAAPARSSAFMPGDQP